MEYQSFLIYATAVILLIVNIFDISFAQENITSVLKSEELIPVTQTLISNCSKNSASRYQCVKIEDCVGGNKRRLGSRRFCKWNEKPTHVCCPQKSVKGNLDSSKIRKKRDDSIYFDDDYSPSSWFNHRYDHDDWNSDNDKSWESPWTVVPRHFHNRFGRDRDYNEEFDENDYGDSRNSFDNGEPECGVLESEEGSRVRARTIGGSLVRTAASTPWMVAVGHLEKNSEPEWFCGGALISKKIVITAAHCITSGKVNLVRVGELDLTSNTDLAEPQDSEIESFVIYPEHKLPRHYHDIGILRLKTPVKYSKYVRPICLPFDNRNYYENSRVTLTGWGNVEYAGENSPILQEVQITVISNSECNSRYSNPLFAISNARTLPRGIISSQMCAGDENGGRDACQGDSGGPIVKKEGRRRVVIGLVSSGFGCGSKFYPGIYTRVSYYSDWIRSFL